MLHDPFRPPNLVHPPAAELASAIARRFRAAMLLISRATLRLGGSDTRSIVEPLGAAVLGLPELAPEPAPRRTALRQLAEPTLPFTVAEVRAALQRPVPSEPLPAEEIGAESPPPSPEPAASETPIPSPRRPRVEELVATRGTPTPPVSREPPAAPETRIEPSSEPPAPTLPIEQEPEREGPPPVRRRKRLPIDTSLRPAKPPAAAEMRQEPDIPPDLVMPVPSGPSAEEIPAAPGPLAGGEPLPFARVTEKPQGVPPVTANKSTPSELAETPSAKPPTKPTAPREAGAKSRAAAASTPIKDRKPPAQPEVIEPPAKAASAVLPTATSPRPKATAAPEEKGKPVAEPPKKAATGERLAPDRRKPAPVEADKGVAERPPMPVEQMTPAPEEGEPRPSPKIPRGEPTVPQPAGVRPERGDLSTRYRQALDAYRAEQTAELAKRLAVARAAEQAPVSVGPEPEATTAKTPIPPELPPVEREAPPGIGEPEQPASQPEREPDAPRTGPTRPSVARPRPAPLEQILFGLPPLRRMAAEARIEQAPSVAPSVTEPAAQSGAPGATEYPAPAREQAPTAEPAPVAPPETPSTPAIDLNALAEQVYQRLRRRLQIEDERLGWPDRR